MDERSDIASQAEVQMRNPSIEEIMQLEKESTEISKKTELECGDCEFRTTDLDAWIHHVVHNICNTPINSASQAVVQRINSSDEGSVQSEAQNTDVSINSGNELKCGKCEFRTRDVDAWIHHVLHELCTTSNLVPLSFLEEDSQLKEEEIKKEDLKRASVDSEDCDPTTPKKRRINKRSDTEMECPECKFRTNVVQTYMHHLRQKHGTTLKLAGLVLLCECGNESMSHHHSIQCDTANFTVIRKTEGLNRRLEEACDARGFAVDKLEDKLHSTPKCPMCEHFPKTVRGYTLHLLRNHEEKSALKENEIFLLCSCGHETHVYQDYRTHKKECNGRNFSVHKLQEKEPSTPRCILCELHPKSVGGYTSHLKKHHSEKSTLIANGIYLVCGCGYEIRTENGRRNHKKCETRDFTLHKLDKK